jgi:hypothetical protein
MPTLSIRPSATISPASALDTFSVAWPIILLMLPTRWPLRLMPSDKVPRQTRTNDSLPLDAVL